MSVDDAIEKTSAAKLGRPRCFCEEDALDRAMRVFWEKGYEGASLTNLTDAMGINRPSLYATFGDKQALFFRSMERYAAGPGNYVRTALEQPTARGVVEALLKGAVKLLADPNNPRGCMSLQGALASGADAEPVRDALVRWRREAEAELRRRFVRARTEGDLPRTVDPGDLAKYVATVLNGLGVQAANGATRTDMARVAEMAMRGLSW